MIGLIGRKLGMTRVFDAEGRQIPVTVIGAGPCTVVQRKTADRDGYDAVQLGFEEQKASRVAKAEAGHSRKAGEKVFKVLREFRLDEGETAEAGTELTVAQFEGVRHLDVTATSKGRGFQGVMKRHGHRGGPATHGSGWHRRPGSIGQRTWPSRVFKGMKMPGQHGNRQVTTQNLEVVQVRPEDSVILVRGAVPGPTGGLVLVRRSLKKGAVA